MADEEIQEGQEQEPKSIWDRLGLTDPEDEYASEEEKADEEIEKEDKLAKKLASRVDDLERKFQQERLAKLKEKFMEQADPLERDLFKTMASECKTPEQVEHAIELARSKAGEMKAKMEEAEAEARKQIERAYGVANPGMPAAPPSDDEEKRMREAIERGDTRIGLKALLADDPFLKQHGL